MRLQYRRLMAGPLSWQWPSPGVRRSGRARDLEGAFTDALLPAPVLWAKVNNNPPGLAQVASPNVIVERVGHGQLTVVATYGFS
jgi:hypothetical protein